MMKVIWKTKDHDIPCQLIKYLGYYNGERWYLIKSEEMGETGAPASQLFINS